MINQSNSQKAYAQAVGSTSTGSAFLADRSPTANDVNGPGGPWKIGQFWQNTSASPSLWYLASFSSTSAVLQANWIEIQADLESVETFTVDSVTPPGVNPVEPDANNDIRLAGGNGVATSSSALNTITVDMESPFTGDFTFQSTTSGDTETVTITNTSNTASSQAQLLVSVAGTSAGDPYITHTVTGAQSFSTGVDNSDSDKYKVSASTAVGTTDFMTMDPGANGNFVFTPNGKGAVVHGNGSVPAGGASDSPNFVAVKSVVGGQYFAHIGNEDNTNAASNALLNIYVGGTSAGDPHIVYTVPSGSSFTTGIDNSASDQFKISADVNLGTNDALAIASNLTTGTFSVDSFSNTRSGTGINVDCAVVNTETTNASSSARLAAGVNAATAGDPYVQLAIIGAATNKFGLDNSDSDAFVYNVGSNAGTAGLEGTTILKMTQAGEITKPLQPAFLATSNTTQTNVTGAGTLVTVAFNTEVFDQNGDYNPATYTFTAPVTGKYYFSATVQVTDLSAAMTTGSLYIVTTARNYQGGGLSPGAVRDSLANSYTYHTATLADMTAGDTCLVRLVVSGGAGDTADINGDVTNTYFSGYLVC